MRFEEIVKHISEEFTQARKDWDMEPLMHFLHTNVSLQSPNVSESILKIKAIPFWVETM
ncbi:hypothetical protein EMGBS15_05830 [Filimonas sp.]|nr:hypothetical protein EMGBS15_05830 [Filimonas sp.]